MDEDAATAEVGPDLVTAARKGDSAAFVAIMRHYDRRLRVVAYQAVRDRSLADDVLQEVAIKAFRNLPRFRGDSSLGTWLSRITWRAALDALEREKRAGRERAERVAQADPPRVVHDPDIAGHIALRDAVEAALAGLPPHLRLTVLLVDREGYDYAAVGRILDVPEGTVASRLSTARSALRLSLAPFVSSEVRQ